MSRRPRALTGRFPRLEVVAISEPEPTPCTSIPKPHRAEGDVTPGNSQRSQFRRPTWVARPRARHLSYISASGGATAPSPRSRLPPLGEERHVDFLAGSDFGDIRLDDYETVGLGESGEQV